MLKVISNDKSIFVDTSLTFCVLSYDASDGAFYKLDGEVDNRWKSSLTPLETNEWLSFMSELHEVWCPDVIGLGFGVWGNPIVMLFKRNPPQKWGVVHCRE